jgi:hypothetical protein
MPADFVAANCINTVNAGGTLLNRGGILVLRAKVSLFLLWQNFHSAAAQHAALQTLRGQGDRKSSSKPRRTIL